MNRIPQEFRRGRYNYQQLSRTHAYARDAALYARKAPRSDEVVGYEVFFIRRNGDEELLPENYDYGRTAWKIKDCAEAWAKFAGLERNVPADTVDIPEWAVSRVRTRMAIESDAVDGL